MTTIMKNLMYMAIVAMIFSFASCNDDPTPQMHIAAFPGGLIAPVSSDEPVMLTSDGDGFLEFSWEASQTADVTYEVFFDRARGDFYAPVERIKSDDDGKRTSVTVTHAQLDEIAEKAGIREGATGTVKWTVVANDGIDIGRSKQENTLSLKRESDAPPVDYAQNMVGEYTGTLAVSGALNTSVPNYKITFERVDDFTLTFQSNVVMPQLGEFIGEITITPSGALYTLTGNATGGANYPFAILESSTFDPVSNTLILNMKCNTPNLEVTFTADKPIDFGEKIAGVYSGTIIFTGHPAVTATVDDFEMTLGRVDDENLTLSSAVVNATLGSFQSGQITADLSGSVYTLTGTVQGGVPFTILEGSLFDPAENKLILKMTGTHPQVGAINVEYEGNK